MVAENVAHMVIAPQVTFGAVEEAKNAEEAAVVDGAVVTVVAGIVAAENEPRWYAQTKERWMWWGNAMNAGTTNARVVVAAAVVGCMRQSSAAGHSQGAS